MKTITLQNLERLSRTWDQRTTKVLVFLGGNSNTFGGSGHMALIELHGDNSIHDTGKIDILGVVEFSYNIARGANGPDSSWAKYYKGVTTLNDLHTLTPTYTVNVEGSTGGSDAAIASILSAKRDWYMEAPVRELCDNGPITG